MAPCGSKVAGEVVEEVGAVWESAATGGEASCGSRVDEIPAAEAQVEQQRGGDC
jgi:hypothetical protein